MNRALCCPEREKAITEDVKRLTVTESVRESEMGLLAKAKGNINTDTHNNNRGNSGNRGMGFLLVFLPEQDNNTSTTSSSSSTIASKTNFLCSPPSSSFKRTNYNAILSRAQSTISICFFLLFTTLLFFTLSTFEPTNRYFLHKPHFTASKLRNAPNALPFSSTALQRMGTLYRRGTRAMNDIVVCHVVEDTTREELQFFLRLLHRSGVTSKSDVVFIFSSRSTMPVFAPIVREENDSFLSLVALHARLNSTRWSKAPESGFDVTRFLKVAKKGEPVWGKRTRSNWNDSEAGEGELTRMSYGSVLSFDANELDPENSLAGFLDRVPLSLRRWACYPMLLGRVRRNFKHVMLVDVKNLLIFNDPLGRVRNRTPESVFLYSVINPSERHGKKNSEKSQHLVNSAILMGGARGVRRLSNAMLIEIVRATMQHKKKGLVSESAILSQLVRNGLVSKNVKLIASSESVPEASSLASSNSAGSTWFSDYLIVQRGMSNYDLNSIIKNHICSSVVDSSVYKDCLELENNRKIKTKREI